MGTFIKFFKRRFFFLQYKLLLNVFANVFRVASLIIMIWSSFFGADVIIKAAASL